MDEWTAATLKEHLDEILTERDRNTREALKLAIEAIERIEERISTMISDHVTRREFAELKSSNQQNKGARTAFAAVFGIVVTLIAVALGAMYDKQLTRSDISEQIDRESPWATDRVSVEARLDAIEKEVSLIIAEHALLKSR